MPLVSALVAATMRVYSLEMAVVRRSTAISLLSAVVDNVPLVSALVRR